MGAQDFKPRHWRDTSDRRCNMLRTWQLALLRFAVTHDHADRLYVMMVASEVDRGGRSGGQGTFSFFRKASARLCSAVLERNETTEAELGDFIAAIENARLRRAFAAAIGYQPATNARKRNRQDDLWRGLAPRGDSRPEERPKRALQE